MVKTLQTFWFIFVNGFQKLFKFSKIVLTSFILVKIVLPVRKPFLRQKFDFSENLFYKSFSPQSLVKLVGYFWLKLPKIFLEFLGKILS